MTRSSLAYIDGHVSRMIAAELKNPTPAKSAIDLSQKPRIIGGFEVMDSRNSEAILADARASRLKQVNLYKKLKTELVEMINECGVEPLAVMPTKMFNMICVQSGLYFVPKRMRTEINPAHFLNWMHEVNQSDGIERQLPVRQMRRPVEKTVENYLKEFSREEVMKHLLTTPHSVETEDEEVMRRLFEARGVQPPAADVTRQASPVNGKMYELMLPVPPQDVQQTLIKLAQFDLKTVAVYGAMDFVGGVEPVLKEARRDHLDREARVQDRVNWMLHDPIVYIERGPVTAVIAQFGPFPVEQKIVDMIQATEFLPA